MRVVPTLMLPASPHRLVNPISYVFDDPAGMIAFDGVTESKKSREHCGATCRSIACGETADIWAPEAHAATARSKTGAIRAKDSLKKRVTIHSLQQDMLLH